MKFHKDGSSPTNGEIFVFGSNLAGIHGAGAAKAAHKYFGATYGVGVGIYGRSYAIPTKDKNIQTLPISTITLYVREFILFVNKYPEKEFFITRIGCGLAGFSDCEIAPLFSNLKDSKNCNFPESWEQYL